MASDYDANLLAILAVDVVPGAEAALKLTPWRGRISWLTGSDLTGDGATLTHRGAEFIARSSVLTRAALVQLWAVLLGPLPLGWSETVTELVATRRNAEGELVAHLSLLWRDMGGVRVTIATRQQVYDLLGLETWVEGEPI